MSRTQSGGCNWLDAELLQSLPCLPNPQASSSHGSSSSAARAQLEELWPVSRLIFEHVDLKAVGCRLHTANDGICIVSRAAWQVGLLERCT